MNFTKMKKVFKTCSKTEFSSWQSDCHINICWMIWENHFMILWTDIKTLMNSFNLLHHTFNEWQLDISQSTYIVYTEKSKLDKNSKFHFWCFLCYGIDFSHNCKKIVAYSKKKLQTFWDLYKKRSLEKLSTCILKKYAYYLYLYYML